jgi:hypothetical protein
MRGIGMTAGGHMSTATVNAPATAAPGFRYLQPTYRLDDTAGQARALEEDGFALIPGVLSPEEVSATRAAIDRCRPFGFDGQGVNDHYKCVFNRERLFLDYADRAGVVDLAYAIWGEWCHIIGMSAWRSRPGHDGWIPHTDRLFSPGLPESVFETPGFKLPMYICTAHYYLNDQTRELCPTYVIPGSHKAGRGPRDKEETEWRGRALEPVLCKAGDVLFFRSEIWHTGSRNTSTDTRYLLQVHYAQRDIAQKFSPWPFQFNPEILAVATPRQLRLLGKHPEGAYG